MKEPKKSSWPNAPMSARVHRGFEMEVRAVEPKGEDDDPYALRLEGYAVVFDEETDLGPFREVIRPGAFTKTLQEYDQLALRNHDTTLPLGRKSAGTLQLAEDEHGLSAGIDMDARISHQKDSYYEAQRGDVKGMSFAFSVVKETFTGTEKSQLREILEARLFEVSPTTNPQYTATEIEARSVLDRALENRETITDEPAPEGHSAADVLARDSAKRKRELQLHGVLT